MDMNLLSAVCRATGHKRLFSSRKICRTFYFLIYKRECDNFFPASLPLFPLPSAPFRRWHVILKLISVRRTVPVPVHKNMFIILLWLYPFLAEKLHTFFTRILVCWSCICFLFPWNTFLSLLLILLCISHFFPPVLQIRDPGSVAFLTPGSGTQNRF